MAGLFTSDSSDLLTKITQERQQANQALASPYGKYAGIVQTGAGLADIGADAMATGGATGKSMMGASDPRMQQMNEMKNVFAQVGMQVGNTSSSKFYEELAKAMKDKFPEQSAKAEEKAMDVKKKEDEEAKRQLELTSIEDRKKSLKEQFPDMASSTINAIAANASSYSSLINKVVAPDTTRFGVDREAIAKELYGKPVKDLSQPELAAVNQRVASETKAGRQIIMQGEGANKPADVKILDDSVTKNLYPLRTGIEDMGQAINFVNTKNPKANVQVDRALASASGDKQLSISEVNTVANAGSFPQNITDSVSKFFTGKSGELSSQQKVEVLRAIMQTKLKLHNREALRLYEMYKDSQFTEKQVQNAIQLTDKNGALIKIDPSYDYRIAADGSVQRKPKK